MLIDKINNEQAHCIPHVQINKIVGETYPHHVNRSAAFTHIFTTKFV
jgi:hypothetical protein